MKDAGFSKKRKRVNGENTWFWNVPVEVIELVNELTLSVQLKMEQSDPKRIKPLVTKEPTTTPECPQELFITPAVNSFEQNIQVAIKPRLFPNKPYNGSRKLTDLEKYELVAKIIKLSNTTKSINNNKISNKHGKVTALILVLVIILIPPLITLFPDYIIKYTPDLLFCQQVFAI